MPIAFLLNQACKFLTLYFIAYLSGLLVLKKNVKVNYTRKINHFALFLLPHVIGKLLPYQVTAKTIWVGSLISMTTLAIYIRPIRNGLRPVAVMFLSYDRPEDRPYTLLWLATQYAATFAVYLPLIYFLRSQGAEQLILLPILINGIGDGLAEPVGVRFGKHTYQTRALFTSKTYTRSLQGSACVFFTSILTVIYLRHAFTSPQFYVALGLIPVAMTLAEAVAPHSWDSPFLFLTAGITLALILYFF